MDNLGMWVVILILAYAVYRLWDSSERESERHHERIYKLEWKVEHLEESVRGRRRRLLFLRDSSGDRMRAHYRRNEGDSETVRRVDGTFVSARVRDETSIRDD